MSKAVADPMIGRLLDGRYRVGPRIARGGMATVYEATDLRLDRICALKIMHQGLGDDDDFAARFVREARSAARLSHPNVVSVFDQGDDNGTLFLAMEYIPGHTMRDLIRKEAPMSPAKALRLIDPVLSALAAAHQAGMIHRDVKPENVLLADDGRVKVADFGLARAVTAETSHTATSGVLIGTVSYLSPELVVDGTADPRSDVYAVGVLIYELLTGRKPHEGESPIQVAYKHVHEDVPPPSRLVPGIPPYVDALVARATARERERRPADARVLLHQVRRVLGALDHGVADDPELTADLTPTTAARDLSSIDYVVEDPPTVVAPENAVAATETTSVIGTRLPIDRPSNPNRPTGSDRRRSRRGPILLVIVLLLAALAGVSGWYFGVGRYTATPGVINLSADQARARVRSAGLDFAIDGRVFSETVAAGSVIRTDPRAGARIPKSGTVLATLSKGAERYGVPALTGMQAKQAERALADNHLSLGHTSERYDEKVAAGAVLSSAPKPGAELRPDAAVDLVLSKGPHPIKVLDVTGKQADRAVAALEKRKLKVETSKENSDTVPQGVVISQTPATGSLFAGDTVRLVESKGPVLVEVPGTTRKNVDDATRDLEAAGFQVRISRSALYIGLNIVVNSDPGSGSMVPKGATITLNLV